MAYAYCDTFHLRQQTLKPKREDYDEPQISQFAEIEAFRADRVASEVGQSVIAYLFALDAPRRAARRLAAIKRYSGNRRQL